MTANSSQGSSRDSLSGGAESEGVRSLYCLVLVGRVGTPCLLVFCLTIGVIASHTGHPILAAADFFNAGVNAVLAYINWFVFTLNPRRPR